MFRGNKLVLRGSRAASTRNPDEQGWSRPEVASPKRSTPFPPLN